VAVFGIETRRRSLEQIGAGEPILTPGFGGGALAEGLTRGEVSGHSG
jgi:hypothetical protein